MIKLPLRADLRPNACSGELAIYDANGLAIAFINTELPDPCASAAAKAIVQAVNYCCEHHLLRENVGSVQ